MLHGGVGKRDLCRGFALGGKVLAARVAVNEQFLGASESTGALHAREMATDTGRRTVAKRPERLRRSDEQQVLRVYDRADGS